MDVEPRVTIGFTTFNNEHYLEGAFDGVLAQDFQDFEIVVCDNQSTDRTWEICETYASKDARFRIFRNERNLGLSGSFARMVSLARGEFIRATSHDDRIAPTLLSRCIEALDKDPLAIAAYPKAILIDKDGNEIGRCEGEPDITGATASRRIVEGLGALACCNLTFGVIRTDALRRTRLLRPFVMGDVPLIIELAALGRCRLVDEFLFYRRETPEFVGVVGGEGIRDRRAWLEPVGAVARKKSTRSEVPLVSRETRRGILGSGLPLGERLTAAGVFSVAWPLRRARARAGALRRRIGRPANAAR